MSSLRILCSLLFAIPSIAQAECGATSDQISALRELVATDPLQMARNAVTEGTPQFLGVAGYTITVPGVDSPTCFIDRVQVRVIPGTTDVRCNREHSRLIERAMAYAEQYNSIVRKALQSKGKYHCDK